MIIVCMYSYRNPKISHHAHFVHNTTITYSALHYLFSCFLRTDYIERRDLTKGLGVEQTWTDYCTGLEAALLFNSYTYTGTLSTRFLFTVRLTRTSVVMFRQ